MNSFRSFLLALLCTESIASRPESDEVHIATNGHFVRAKLSVDREDKLEHGRRQHRKATEEYNSVKREMPHSQVAFPHRMQEVEVHDSTRDKHNTSGTQGARDNNISDHERSQRRIHMSATMHEEAKRYEKVLSDDIVQSERNQNSSIWKKEDQYAYQDATRSWNDCLPYLVTRVFIIALIIYTFMRNHLSQPLQEINDLVVKQRRQEVNTHPVETRNEGVRQSKTEAQAAPQACRQAGQSVDEDQNQEGRAQPVEERLGKAIEDSLSEVEEWLRTEAEVSNGVVAQYDISTPRGEPAPKEPPIRHYQRRKLPRSPPSATTSAALAAPANA